LFGITKGAEYLITVTNTRPNESISADTYIVRRGDTLSRISARYGVRMSRLLELNPDIANANLIYVGQALRLQ